MDGGLRPLLGPSTSPRGAGLAWLLAGLVAAGCGGAGDRDGEAGMPDADADGSEALPPDVAGGEDAAPPDEADVVAPDGTDGDDEADEAGPDGVDGDGGGDAPDGDVTGLDRIARYCIYETICRENWAFADRLQECVQGAPEYAAALAWGERREIERAAACAEAAGADCDAYIDCVLDTDWEPCTPIGPLEPAPYCDGDDLLVCTALDDTRAVWVRQDCAARGETCVTPEEGRSGCSWGTCPDPGTAWCEDDVAVHCTGDPPGPGGRWEIDCGGPGLVCVDAMCTDPDAAPCTEDSCDGSLMRECPVGRTLTSDCGVIDPSLVCLLEAGHSPRCVFSPGDGCIEGGDGDDCDGDVARICVAGGWVRIDCTLFPGARCELRHPGIPTCRAP